MSEPGRPGSITVGLVDDHRVVRAGLALLLERHPELRVVAQSGSVAGTRALVGAHRPDVLVLDADLPDGSSLPAIPELRAVSPDTRIVVLTMHTDLEIAREALRSGATGFVLKAAAEAELIDAIRAAAAGRAWLAPELGARLAAGAGGEDAADELSPREREVLALLAAGHTNGEVAERLFISVRTVESHRARIQQKSGCGSRAELVRFARARGIA